MALNFDEILLELSYRVPEGYVDLTKDYQVTELSNILKENGYQNAFELAHKARVYFSYLHEAGESQFKGYVHRGAGYYSKTKDGEVTHKSDNGTLRALTAKEKADKEKGVEKPSKPSKPPKVDIGVSSAEKSKGSDKAQKRSGTESKPEKREPQILGKLDDETLRKVEDEYVKQSGAESADMAPMDPNYSKKGMAQGYSDKEYYSEDGADGQGHSTQVRKKPFLFDKKTQEVLISAGFPKEYISFIERCINTEVDGKQPPVTELIKQGGAGQIQSQFGEVMAMAFMSIRDKGERKKLAETIISEIGKSVEEFGGGKASAIATKDWVEASLSHGESFDASMDEIYGKGQWKFEGAAWDKREDVEAMGLSYAQKGFSTDVVLRVQPLKNGKPNGPAQAQRCSLKKDENIMFFNGSVNEVENFILNFVSENERRRAKSLEMLVSKAQDGNKNKEERKAARETIERLTKAKNWQEGAQMVADEAKAIRDKAYSKAPDDVKAAVNGIREFNNKQNKSALKLGYYASVDMKPAELKNAVESAYKSKSDRKFATEAHKIVKSCAEKNGQVTQECVSAALAKINPKKATTKYVNKACVAAAEVAKAAGYDVDKELDKHYSIAKEAGNALIKAIPKSKELLGGVMQKLADAFPLKVCMDGTEFMLIDGVHVTAQTLQSVFGVQDYDDLNKGLTIVEDENGDAILVFTAGGKKQIPVGYVDARQKGKGFEGTVGFEILCNDEFVRKCAESNVANGDTSDANSNKLRQLNQRKEKKEKRKQSSDDDTNDEE